MADNLRLTGATSLLQQARRARSDVLVALDAAEAMADQIGRLLVAAGDDKRPARQRPACASDASILRRIGVRRLILRSCRCHDALP